MAIPNGIVERVRIWRDLFVQKRTLFVLIFWSVITGLDDLRNVGPVQWRRPINTLIPDFSLIEWVCIALVLLLLDLAARVYHIVQPLKTKLDVYRKNNEGLLKDLEQRSGERDRALAEVGAIGSLAESLGRQIAGLSEERDALRDRLAVLRLEFDPRDPNCQPDGGGMTCIKVINEGRARADKVSIVLSSMRPTRSDVHGAFPLKGPDPPHQTAFEVSPGSTLYVMVLWQDLHASYGFSKHLALHPRRLEVSPELTGFALVLHCNADVEVGDYELVFETDGRRLAHVVGCGPVAATAVR